MTEQKATNITWHEETITRQQREELFNHRGVVVWFTGLSGSGKSTLSQAVACALHARGCHTYVLDGDNVRHGLSKDLGFSADDRHENIRRIGEVAKLFADAGLIVMTAFISPYIKDRQMARSLNEAGDFIEVFCDCSLDVCEERDPKGLYKKARLGEIKNFTGIDAPYEEPPDPEVDVHTDNQTVEESVRTVLEYMERTGYIAKSGAEN